MFLRLFYEFFKVGLFSVGGGLATLPFLYDMSRRTGWFTTADISNLVAISESTPGPLGINMSTYVGFLHSKLIGAVIAPIGLIFPSIVIIIIIAKFLEKFQNSKTVDKVFYGLRAASAALIAAAGIGIVKIAFFANGYKTFFYKGAILAVVIYIMMRKFKWHPVIFIAISAIVGIVFKFNL